MPSYTQSLYHVVFGTKHRRPSLNPAGRGSFLTYCNGIIRGMDAHVYRINCVEDHIHILADLPATLDVATFVKRFKLSSGNCLRDQSMFSQFDRWQEKYGAFSTGWESRNGLIEYIKNQQEHHRHESFIDEFKRLLREVGLEWDPRDEDS
jgi:REP element-mobilizing transposase RayT